jgi:hypothetical protein
MEAGRICGFKLILQKAWRFVSKTYIFADDNFLQSFYINALWCDIFFIEALEDTGT